MSSDDSRLQTNFYHLSLDLFIYETFAVDVVLVC